MTNTTTTVNNLTATSFIDQWLVNCGVNIDSDLPELDDLGCEWTTEVIDWDKDLDAFEF